MKSKMPGFGPTCATGKKNCAIDYAKVPDILWFIPLGGRRFTALAPSWSRLCVALVPLKCRRAGGTGATLPMAKS